MQLIRISSRSIKTSTIYRNVQAAAATSEKLSIPVPEGSDKPANPKLDTIVSQIAGLNLLEVSELSGLLKKKLNLPDTAMMPMGFAQGGAAASAAPGKDSKQFILLHIKFKSLFFQLKMKKKSPKRRFKQLSK